MAAHMVACDAAFGAPGSATWERACIGLPMALVATAENQVPLLEQLGKAGFAAYLGRASELDAARFVAAFAAFLAYPQTLVAQRARGVAGVDGQGTERVARHLQTRGVELV
jgi:spore coat polysaccharide biosynthesis predicted glycosyltransferase SpsG